MNDPKPRPSGLRTPGSASRSGSVRRAHTRRVHGGGLRKNARGGHLPGARRVGHADLLTAEGRLRQPQELRTMLESAGFSPGERIVTHCDGGGRAALAALAAVQAGFTRVNTYYLSFSDWAKDESCPIVRDGES